MADRIDSTILGKAAAEVLRGWLNVVAELLPAVIARSGSEHMPRPS
jgi:hypothetical protein